MLNSYNLFSNALLRAAAKGDLEAVKAAIKAGTDVNTPQSGTFSQGYSPLHVAAEKGHLDIVEELIKSGAMVDARDKEMNTPLMQSVRYNGTLDVVKCLVEHGADIKAKNNRGMMPLEWASYNNQEYMHSLERKLLGENRYEAFGKIIKFTEVVLGNEGKSFGLGKTDEKCSLLINGKLTEIPIGTWMYPGTFSAMIFPDDILLTVGSNDILFAKDEKINVSFDKKSGNLTTEIGVLAKDMTLTVGIMNIPFYAKRYDPEYAQYRGQASMHFHGNGSINEGYVSAKDFTLKIGANGITFRGDQIMEFDKDGGISKGVMSSNADLIVGKNKIAFTGRIASYPSGNIHSGTLEKDVALLVGKNAINFENGWTISFFEDGSVESGNVKDEMSITVNGQNKILKKQSGVVG